jgi:hypothetical protein
MVKKGTGAGAGGGAGGAQDAGTLVLPDDLDLTFPVPIAGYSPGLPVPGGTAPAGGENRVQAALRQILGRVPAPRDTRSFVSALRQTFQPRTVGTRLEFTWNPQSFLGSTDLGGVVTGAQAALYATAAANLERCLPLLDALYPLDPTADFERIESARLLVRTTVVEIVDGLKSEGGPNADRIEFAFQQLFGTVQKDDNGTDVTGTTPTPDRPGGFLGTLRFDLKLFDNNVITIEDENNRTNFLTFSDFVSSTMTSWTTFLKSVKPLIGGTGVITEQAERDFGTTLVLVSQTLSVCAESVREFNAAADFLFIGAAERQTTKVIVGSNPTFTFDLLPPKLPTSAALSADPQFATVAELLSWVDDFATNVATRLVREGGKRGLQQVATGAKRLGDNIGLLVLQLKELPITRGALTLDTSNLRIPEGLKRKYAIRPLEELIVYLFQLSERAK